MLFEFYDLLGSNLDNEKNFSENLKSKEKKYKSFFQGNPFRLLLSLHYLVKREIKGESLKTAHRGLISELHPLSDNSKSVQQVSKDKVSSNYELYPNTHGSNKIDEEDKKKLLEAMQEILTELKDEHTFPINIMLPEYNGNIPMESEDELFNSVPPFKEAENRANTLLKQSKNNFQIIMVCSKKIMLLSKDKPSVIKPYNDLTRQFPCIASLILWNSINAYKIQYKKSPPKSLLEKLGPNCALDIEIMLNSFCVADCFITSDKEQHDYSKIIFQDEFFPLANEKILLLK